MSLPIDNSPYPGCHLPVPKTLPFSSHVIPSGQKRTPALSPLRGVLPRALRSFGRRSGCACRSSRFLFPARWRRGVSSAFRLRFSVFVLLPAAGGGGGAPVSTRLRRSGLRSARRLRSPRSVRLRRGSRSTMISSCDRRWRRTLRFSRSRRSCRNWRRWSRRARRSP